MCKTQTIMQNLKTNLLSSIVKFSSYKASTKKFVHHSQIFSSSNNFFLEGFIMFGWNNNSRKIGYFQVYKYHVKKFE